MIDMHTIRDKMEGSDVGIFWRAVGWAIEINNGSGDHRRYHTANYNGVTVRLSYDLCITSIKHLIKRAIQLLIIVYELSKGIEFEVLCKS